MSQVIEITTGTKKTSVNVSPRPSSSESVVSIPDEARGMPGPPGGEGPPGPPGDPGIDVVHHGDDPHADRPETAQPVLWRGRANPENRIPDFDIWVRDPDQIAFSFEQPAPANEWAIDHGMGYEPSVSIADSAGNSVHGEVTYDSKNRLTVRFRGAFSGYAYLS
jgi:hypothetical protein